LEKRVPTRLSPAEGRRFGLTVGAAFAALAALLWWRGHGATAPLPATLGALLMVAGVVAPARLELPYRGWMGLATALSRITTPIFLGITYFGVIAPIGLLRRLAGRNSLVRRSSQSTFWIPREAGARTRSGMEHLF
jgi:hypothetical protein